MPSEIYASGFPNRGMYFSESNGSFGTHGLASADQFSCQRLNMIAGRAHDAAVAIAAVAAPKLEEAAAPPVVAVSSAPPSAVSAAETGSTAAIPVLISNTRIARSALRSLSRRSALHDVRTLTTFASIGMV